MPPGKPGPAGRRRPVQVVNRSERPPAASPRPPAPQASSSTRPPGRGADSSGTEGDPMPAETAVLGWLARVAAWLRSTPQAEAPL
jgi:hypothetical protein